MFVNRNRRPPACITVLIACVVLLGAAPPGGRVLRIGMALQPDSLDPLIATTYSENYIEEAVFDGLTVLDDRGRATPDLAVAVPTRANGGISADGRTLTYHLRHDVRWQDGIPFTARDVVFTFARMRDPNVPFASTTWYEIIERLSAPDPYTIVIRLKRPSADATSELFVNGEMGMIVPEHALRNVRDFRSAGFNGAPIGTGPYAVVRWDRGTSLDLVANPQYFRGAPHIARIHVAFIADQNTLALQMLTGELDFAQQLPLTQRHAFEHVTGLSVHLVPTYLLDYLIANTRAAPLDDVRVRRALALAIDRQPLVTKAYLGGALLADSFEPPWSPFYTAAPRSALGPDLGEANRLLDDAGWRRGPDGRRRRNGVALELPLTTIAGQTVMANEAVVLQAVWSGLGIDVPLRPVQFPILFAPTGVLAQGSFALALISYGELPWPDISEFVAGNALPPAGENYARLVDPQIDAWLHQSAATFDVTARRSIVAAFETRLRERAPEIPLLWERFLYAWSADLLGVRPETANSDFWNVADWRWRAGRE
jgi:peptide/nickel transport system substrate-binding protein